jgi:hypothetical protein
MINRLVRMLGLLAILAMIVTMWSCAIRIHNLPPMDYRIQEKEAGKIIFLQTFPLLFLAGVVVFFVIQYDERTEARKKAEARTEWENNHTHDWDGCICRDPQCGNNRHELDAQCVCKNCQGSFHKMGPSSIVDYRGSSAIESSTCIRCGEEQLSSYYAG